MSGRPRLPNGMTYAEAERLHMLAEEAAEVAHACMKALRHGWDSKHPHFFRGPTNRELLERELTDLSAVARLMHQEGELSLDRIRGGVAAAAGHKLRYAHHQGACSVEDDGNARTED